MTMASKTRSLCDGERTRRVKTTKVNRGGVASIYADVYTAVTQTIESKAQILRPYREASSTHTPLIADGIVPAPERRRDITVAIRQSCPTTSKFFDKH